MVSCKEYVTIKKEELKEKIKTFVRPPKLCVIQVGNNPASNSYIRGKRKDAEEVGIEFVHIKLPEDVEQGQLEHQVQLQSCINDGVIIQLPLPKHIDVERITKLIPANKDVDGFRSDSCFKPCTPKGVVDWLEYNEVNLEGKVCTVIGRSEIVGRPLVNMLIKKGATVISCNSKTINLENYTRFADIVFSAIGKANYINHKYFLPDRICDQILVDVGINRDENGKLCGDIDNTIKSFALHGTPVPGSIGLTTRLSLVENTVEAYELNMEE